MMNIIDHENGSPTSRKYEDVGTTTSEELRK